MAQLTKEVEIYPDAGEKVIQTPECISYLERVAKAAESNAVSIAPVLTGAYRDSIRSGVLSGQAAPASYLSADVDYWFYLEYGTINNDPFRTLTQSVQAQVDRWEEGGG
jgi:hypothetical protein